MNRRKFELCERHLHNPGKRFDIGPSQEPIVRDACKKLRTKEVLTEKAKTHINSSGMNVRDCSTLIVDVRNIGA